MVLKYILVGCPCVFTGNVTIKLGWKNKTARILQIEKNAHLHHKSQFFFLRWEAIKCFDRFLLNRGHYILRKDCKYGLPFLKFCKIYTVKSHNGSWHCILAVYDMHIFHARIDHSFESANYLCPVFAFYHKVEIASCVCAQTIFFSVWIL